jgi:hypothetical protein
MVAGLAIQVASLTAFTIIGVEFALRVYKNRNHLNPTHADVYNSQRFKLFLGGKSRHIIIFIYSPVPFSVCYL